LHDALSPYADDLRTLFIVSRVALVKGGPPSGAFQSTAFPELSILVAPAAEEKCERCWVHDATVGSDTTHPTICKRCADAIHTLENTVE
jgi:isoleucyl-tRNA synthetase